MQVNRLSLGLQEELQKATNFNTARSENLFDSDLYQKNDNGEVDFSSIELEDLNISDSQIQTLLGAFTDEITKFFMVQPQQKESLQNVQEKTQMSAKNYII